MAKRKQRGSPAGGGGGGGGGGASLLSSMPARLSRGFPRELRPESQAKRVATLIPLEDSPQKQQQQQRLAMHSPAAAAKAEAAAAAAIAATARATTTVTLSREEPINSSSSSSSSSMASGSSATAGAGAGAAISAEANLRSSPLEEGEMDSTPSVVGGALLMGPVRSVTRGEYDQRGPEGEEGAPPPGLMPLGCGSRPAFGAVSPASPAAARGGGVHECGLPSSPPPPPLSGIGNGSRCTAVSPTTPTIESSARCTAVRGAGSVNGAINGSPAGAGVGQDSKQAALKAMMLKAKMASDNIRLLLHAKRCDGMGCKEPGCDSARQLVKHMRGCQLTGEIVAGCNVKCVQAQKMLQHYAECNRKRALGGRYCLVCSLVARSATTNTTANSNSLAKTTNNIAHNNNNNINASVSGNAPLNRRLPLRHLAPGSAHPARQGASACGQRKNATRGDGGIPSPVAITRLRKGNSRPGQLKDGVFFRPLPKARRGSWGGYDRCQYLRRTRFDSIPEELTEEDGDGDEDDDDDVHEKESAASGGSKSNDESGRSKTLVSSHSL